MPSPPRLLIPHSVVLITTRMEEGLPLVPTAFIKVIIEGVLGRAQKLYPVVACHYIFMNNHLHLILVVTDPDAVAGFMDRVKTELAHAVNRLLGRRKRTVWYDSYDAVPILTVEDCIEKIAYVYTNPPKAGLVDSIDEYPGVSSWRLYREGKGGFAARWIRRPMIKRLKSLELSQAEQAKLAKELTSQAKQRVVFRLYPDAWMGCFGVEEKGEIEAINEHIVTRVRQLEEGYQAERQKTGVKAVGVNRLRSQRMDKPYTPQSFGNRMWCICHDVALRASFIDSVKGLLWLARKIRERWRTGDFSLPYPLGLFPPRMERLGNPILGVAAL